MNLAFLGAELSRWDQAAREGTRVGVIGLPFFEDERPLRGVAGLCDWRLGGRLSRLLVAEGRARLRGAFGERLLMPAGRRLPWERLLLFGLGPSQGFDEACARQACAGLLGALRAVVPPREQGHDTDGRSTTLAVVPPGRSTGVLSARQALEILLQEAGALWADAAPPQLLVLESAAGQKEAGEVARRLAADLGSSTVL